MISPTVLSVQELHVKAENMQEFLESKYSTDEAQSLFERCEALIRLMAESGKCLADAKWYRDKVIDSTIMESLKKSYENRLSASTINKYVDAAAKDYNFLVNWFDRINASATHQNDGIRTIISYKKEEMKL